MNIIGIGCTELIFILLIALVFLGPGKMVEIAQKIVGNMVVKPLVVFKNPFAAIPSTTAKIK